MPFDSLQDVLEGELTLRLGLAGKTPLTGNSALTGSNTQKVLGGMEGGGRGRAEGRPMTFLTSWMFDCSC